MKTLFAVLATALVVYVGTTLYDENVTQNQYFHVECQEPEYSMSGVGPAYGPDYLVKDDQVAMLAWKFCIDATPMLKWTQHQRDLAASNE